MHIVTKARKTEAVAREMYEESREIAVAAAEALFEGKGEDIALLDLSALPACADFFVIATGNSVVHMRSLTERVMELLARLGFRNAKIEGEESTAWILLDYPSVLVHVFSSEARNFYGLERLWGDAEIVDWQQEFGPDGQIEYIDAGIRPQSGV